jgi:hypothetical protein
MSPFMSSMPAAGLIEMPPVSKHTPLPMKATGCRRLLAAVPAHDHDAALVLGAPSPARRRAARPCRASHRLDVEHLDLDAELAQLAGAAREFLRIEHVRRLVDEVARDDDAVGLAGADHDQPRGLQAGRRHDVERAAALAGEALRFGGARHQIGADPSSRAGLRPELQVLVGEHHQNAARAPRSGRSRVFGHPPWNWSFHVTPRRKTLSGTKMGQIGPSIAHCPARLRGRCPGLAIDPARSPAAVRRGTLRRGELGIAAGQ